MAEKEKRSERPIIKLYIIILFFCGIGLWFAMQTQPKEKISLDVELDKRVVNVLVANGISQEDIISQYVREREMSKTKWNEFYKKIKLKKGKTADSFEAAFRSVARGLKVGLSKTENADGSVTYKFYSTNRNYSNITFINASKPGK